MWQIPTAPDFPLATVPKPPPHSSSTLHPRFCVAFDPLDGSSNIDCNVSTGTIFAVYEKKGAGPASAEDILRTGNDIVVAGYCMYGAATELVVTFKGKGVHGFTLDPSLGASRMYVR